jgi:hypothetical protein
LKKLGTLATHLLMKLHSSLILVTALVAVLPFRVTAAPSSISVQVETTGSRQEEDRGQKTTESKTLKITLNNSAPQDFTNLSVKYFIFAKDATTKKTSVFKQGEKTAALGKMAATIVMSDPVTLTFEKERYSKKGGGGSGKNGGAQNSGKQPATGDKYEGYGVQVFSGGTLQAEAFSSMELKDKMK